MRSNPRGLSGWDQIPLWGVSPGVSEAKYSGSNDEKRRKGTSEVWPAVSSTHRCNPVLWSGWRRPSRCWTGTHRCEPPRWTCSWDERPGRWPQPECPASRRGLVQSGSCPHRGHTAPRCSAHTARCMWGRCVPRSPAAGSTTAAASPQLTRRWSSDHEGRWVELWEDRRQSASSLFTQSGKREACTIIRWPLPEQADVGGSEGER